MLWKLGDAGVHLVGSCHLLQDSDYPISPRLEEVYGDSRLVVLESDTHRPEVKTFGLGTGEETLLSVEPELYSEVNTTLTALGEDTYSFPFSKPWGALLKLSIAVIAKEGFTFDQGLDQHFRHRAEADSKVVSFLESPFASLNCFESMPVALQLAHLRKTLAEPDLAVREAHRIIEGWRRSNEKELVSLLDELLDRFPELYGCLITARNNSWLAKIFHLISQRMPTLLCVGVLHCVGQYGLPALLAEQGFMVSRLQ